MKVDWIACFPYDGLQDLVVNFCFNVMCLITWKKRRDFIKHPLIGHIIN
jgi:hypothetical protein